LTSLYRIYYHQNNMEFNFNYPPSNRGCVAIFERLVDNVNKIIIIIDEDDNNIVPENAIIIKFNNPNISDKIKNLDKKMLLEEFVSKVRLIILKEDLIYNHKIDLPYVIQISDEKKKYFYCNRIYKTLGNNSSTWQEYPIKSDRQIYLYMDIYAQIKFESYINKFRSAITQLKFNNYELIGLDIKQELKDILFN
jgi:hypothetical protein